LPRDSGTRHREPKRAGIWESFQPEVVEAPERPAIGDPLVHARYWTLLLLVALNLVHLAQMGWGVELPHFLRSPLWLPLLSCLAFYFMVRAYTRALRSFAFYGRFIRPGLQRLLREKGDRISAGEKLFRGHKTVIMKLDMADYTRTTFEMPYGMRRLFQDLWFTLIDQVVYGKVFLDKSLGDGSVYCFEDGLPGGSCTAALETALAIRDGEVARFDALYRRRLREQLAAVEELRGPAERYLERYRGDSGRSFWEERTLIRVALVAGYVDEGLWGLVSQSHYDVQGGPLILATRIEAQAENGEIVFDQRFLEELERESPGLVDGSRLEQRELELKGIGAWRIYVLPEDVGVAGLPRRGPAGLSPASGP